MNSNIIGAVLAIPLTILMLYGMFYAMMYWPYVLLAMIPISIIGTLFGFIDLRSPSSNSSNNSPEGTYVVYDLGKPKVQVDRFHIRKN